MTRKAIIVYIDVTVATHYDEKGVQLREHHDYSQVKFDLPVQPIIDLVRMYEDRGYHIILFQVEWIIADKILFSG